MILCLGALVSLLPGICAADSTLLLPMTQSPFPALNGSYAVGVADYLWVDGSRPEAFSNDPDDERHLRIRVWYPVNSTVELAVAPYLPCLDEFESPELFRGLTTLPSRSFLGGGIATDEPKFPVLIYSHGAGWTRFSGSFITEEMASQGYIVVAIGHTGLNRSTRFPEGYDFNNDVYAELQSNVKVAMASGDPEATEGAQASMAGYMDDSFSVWVDDAVFVLNQLDKLSNTDEKPWSARLDMDRVGMFGWSFGGALALEMTYQDERVLAGINHDGGQWGDIIEKGSSRPVMIMHSDWHNNENPEEPDEMLMEALEKQERTRSNLNSDWYELDFTNAGHGHFSDVVQYANPEHPAFAAMRTQDDATRVHNIIVDYTLAFFDHYLKGKSSPLLDGPSEAYPEVTYESNQAH
jgi:predicted dienelactone hydrolase